LWLFSENRKPETENGIKGVFPLETGSGKDSLAGPLTALFFMAAAGPGEENHVKICSNYLG
jgi:hypothetical protein